MLRWEWGNGISMNICKARGATSRPQVGAEEWQREVCQI